MLILYLKAFHVISVVAWFAALFYFPRLLIYDVDSKSSDVQTQLRIMQRRLFYGIMWPACIATWIFGLALMWQTSAYLEPWFHLKFGMVLALLVFHLTCGRLRKAHEKGQCPFTSKQLRIFNELPTLALIGIVLTAFLKYELNLSLVAFCFWGSVLAMLEWIRRSR